MRTLRLALGVVLAALLVGCGSDDDPRPTPGGRNEADEIFVEVAGGNIGTLRQILGLAEEQAGSDKVIDLAEELEAALGEVREQLQAWEDDWDLPQEIYGAVPELPQQDKSEDWKELEALEGEEFDALWLEVVSSSLEAAQSSAETVIERGQDRDVRELAERLVQDCADWIAELERLGA